MYAYTLRPTRRRRTRLRVSPRSARGAPRRLAGGARADARQDDQPQGAIGRAACR